ncbi:xylulokinase [Pseudomonas sp. NFXW11]|uniref:xylulokinase n=1 Tax=Pseudomonas sp. NFXW11 TaxID=2819531 RepID=UPI003CFB18C4
MTTARLFLGIDCGTQGTKALILDSHSGAVLGLGSAPHSLISGANGRREQEPEQWLHASTAAVHQALQVAGVDGRDILGIGVSAQQHGLVLLDKQGQVLRPAKLWCDTESSAENQRLLEHLGGTRGSLERLGLALAPGYTVSKLLWTLEQHPQLLQRIGHILLPHDYLNFWLSGRCCSEYGDASGTGYFDVRRRDWDRPLLAHIDPSGGLEQALPQLIESHQAVGRVLPEIARQLGINPEALVASGGGDNMLGAIGTGNIRPGIITMSLGSSGTLYAYSDQPQVAGEAEVACFCSSSGGWLPLICSMNLTNATHKVRELLELDLATFNLRVAEAPIGTEGLRLLPFFNGERVPALPQARGQLLGMTLDNLTQANLCRAVVEGCTLGLRYGLDLLRANGLQSRSIRLIGGGAKSPLWRQMVADIMGTEVICPRETEAAALGAAIQAAWCHGRQSDPNLELQQLCERCVSLDPYSQCQPRAEQMVAYEALYADYLKLLSTL